MQDELHELDKTHTRDLVDPPFSKPLVGCKGYIKSRFFLMVLLSDTKLVSLQNGSLRSMILIMRKPFPQLLASPQFKLFLPL